MAMLIGLTGFKRSGKDTVFGFLKGLGFVRCPFADRVRALVHAINPLIVLGPLEDLKFGGRTPPMRLQEYVEIVGWEEAKSEPEVRRLLQATGAEAVRDIVSERAWIDALDRKLDLSTNTCITDVRFPNEVDYVHEKGGVVWRINRPGFGGDDPHPTEAHIPALAVDQEILNDGTLDALRRRVCVAFVRSAVPK